MYNFYRVVLLPFDWLVIGLVWVYRLTIKPLKPKCCRFIPTCSMYMILAIKEWGVIEGVWQGLKRLGRCNPRNNGGYDPVKMNMKGGHKWLL